jgi:glycosyltransferase involved in cell wall biosynthesis
MRHNNFNSKSNKLKLCFVVNNSAFFVSHRLPIALEAIKSGYGVYLLVGNPGSVLMELDANNKLREFDITVIQCRFSSDGLNPLIEVFQFFKVLLQLRKIKPHLVHCISPKGILYGGLAAKLLKTPKLVIAISGMGSLFTNEDRRYKLFKIISILYRHLLSIILSCKNKTIIVQNQDDRDFILKFKNVRHGEIVLIPGSGVDLKLFSQIKFEDKDKIVLFPARILKDKGAFEFVNAARILKVNFPEWKFIMAGTSDYANPSKISEQIIDQWVLGGYIEWLGYVPNMVGLYAKASIVCLPSYREGMPKALLEAAAAGCAVVTTNAIGCKDAIIPNVTGVLVPVCDVPSLVDALASLMDNNTMRSEFGRAAISLATEKYSLDSVVRRTMDIYSNNFQGGIDSKDY